MSDELFDRARLKLDACASDPTLRHGPDECGSLCLGAQPGSPCECGCNGVCHSLGRCVRSELDNLLSFVPGGIAKGAPRSYQEVTRG